MSDYERITEAFKQAGLGFRVSREDEHWKSISIDDGCHKGDDIPTGYSAEVFFRPDGSLVSIGVEG